MNVDDKTLSTPMGLVHGWTDAAVAMDGINSGALAAILLGFGTLVSSGD